MGTKTNARPNAVPEGKNNEKKCIPCSRIHTILRPIKIERAKPKVTTKWLVTVKLYGINPIKFDDKTNKKMNCESYQQLTPIEASTLIGQIVHLVQSDEWYFEQAKALIKMGEGDGLFDKVKINPIIEPQTETPWSQKSSC